MTVWEVLLVFVGIPLGVFLLMAAAVYGGSSRRNRRYRPGRPFEFTPVWFLAAPERIIGPASVPAPEPSHDSAMLPAGPDADGGALAAAGSGTAGSGRGVKGGASGSW